MLSGFVKAKEGLRKVFAQPSYDELMSHGAYFLQNGRPDMAEGYFRRAIGQQDSPEPWRLYAWSLLDQGKMGMRHLDERIWYEHDGTSYRDHVRLGHKKVASLEPSAENYYEAALIALSVRDLKDVMSYLAKALESDPDDSVLIRIGRLTKTLKMDGLTKIVEKLSTERELSVHLYPL